MPPSRTPITTVLADLKLTIEQLDAHVSELGRPGPLLVGRVEAAEMLGIGDTTLRTLAYAGTLESVHIGNRMLFPVDGLRDYVTRLRATPEAQGPPPRGEDGPDPTPAPKRARRSRP